VFFFHCKHPVQKENFTTKRPQASSTKKVKKEKVLAKPREILDRQQVPILCYHRLRDYRTTDGRGARTYIVPADVYRRQIKMLADSGYNTITPDQYYAYLNFGSELPEKPVMVSFDDTSEEQFTVGAAELDKYGFKGVFFVMTISIGRPGYMSTDQLRALSDKGHVIASHTTDHHNVKKYSGEDWDFQLAKPKNKLEMITGKPVEYFAYPFGEWNETAIPELKKRNYKAAFQLSSNKRDTIEPLYAIRRMIVPGTWDGSAMDKWMKVNF
jgi:peptidoglycan/xylan/chitin deacetylase (PgdA/CDA1 family)